MAKPPKKSAPPKKAAKSHASNGKNGAKSIPVPVSKPAVKLAKVAAPPAAPKLSKAQAELIGKIVHLISEDMAIEEAELTPNASLREDLGLDEIDLAELLMVAESEFHLNHPFGEADWDRLQTVDDVVELVSKRVETQKGKNGKKAARG